MVGLFDILFGQRSKPVRREEHVRLTVDADGNPTIETVEGVVVTLSSDGSIDRIRISPDRFYHCGCSAQEQLGGQCGEPGCRRTSCVRCFGRCAACQKPTCLEHARYLDAGQGQPIRLCSSCHDALSRKRRLHAIAKCVLSPFITFEEWRKS